MHSRKKVVTGTSDGEEGNVTLVQPAGPIRIPPPSWNRFVKLLPISRLTTPGSTDGRLKTEKPMKCVALGVPPKVSSRPLNVVKLTGSFPLPACKAGVGFCWKVNCEVLEP